jgi:hypothetical protein
VRMADNTKLVATGKIRTKSPLFMTRSPGNLNSGILGKTRKTRPTKTNTVPKTIKNLAINCNCVNGLLFFLLVRYCRRKPRFPVGLLEIGTLLFL